MGEESRGSDDEAEGHRVAGGDASLARVAEDVARRDKVDQGDLRPHQDGRRGIAEEKLEGGDLVGGGEGRRQRTRVVAASDRPARWRESLGVRERAWV